MNAAIAIRNPITFIAFAEEKPHSYRNMARENFNIED
jgi:hypothetical protein